MTGFRSASFSAFIAMLLAFAGMGCHRGSEETTPAADSAGSPSPSIPRKQLVIGVTYQNLQNEFVINIQDALRAKAKELNVKLIQSDGQGRAENQISQVENFIVQKVDAIILNPFDRDSCARAVAKARAARIPIVVVNAVVSNLDQAGAYIGSNDSEAGRIEMQYIADLLGGKGNIAIIHGPSGHSAEAERSRGIREVLAKYPQIQVAVEQTANWDRAQAMTLMENWLQTGRKIDAVVAQNDEMALGASKAIEASGQKDMKVIGIDAIPDALKAVADGKLAGTVFQDARGQGTLAVELARQLADGKPVEHDNYLPFQLVTKENLANFMKSN